MAVAKRQKVKHKELIETLSGLTRDHIVRAAETYQLRKGVVPTYQDSTVYDLLVDERRYPPKAILGLAAQELLGYEFPSSKFSGGLKSPCFSILENLGFTIVTKDDPLRRLPRHSHSREEVAATTGISSALGASSWRLSGTLTEGLPPKATSKTGKGEKETKDGIIDWAAREQKNRDLGLAGELLVMEHEKKRLCDAGRNDLAYRVEHIALSDSAAGYDIISFELDGGKRFIEVKTTTGPASTPFYISENEVVVSRDLQEQFWLYRVHSYSRENNSAEFYVKNGDVSTGFELAPTTYKAIPV